MGFDEGRSGGLTGLFDLPGQGVPKFQVWVRAHAQQLKVEILPDPGRGDSEWPAFIPGNSSGGLTVGAQISLDGWPAPDKLRGEAGSVVVQFHTGITGTYPVVVEAASFTKSSKEQGAQDATFILRVTGAPVFAGFPGDQPVSADPAYTDKQLWPNLAKTLDLQGLGSSATQRWRWWGTGDDDASENAKMAAFAATLSASPPSAGLKLRPSTMTRLSKWVLYFDTTWGLTDTAEDVVNPITSTTLDANHLTSQAQAALINATPSTPGGDSFVPRETTTRELNDAKLLTSRTFGLRSTVADVEMPGTVKKGDVSAQEDVATVTIVNGSSTPPAAPAAPYGVLVATESEQLNAVPKWRHTFHYANTTPEQRILFADSVPDVDAGGLQDTESVAVATPTSSPPGSPPATPSGLVLRRRRAVRLVGTPEKWEHTYFFARTTTKDDVENDNSSARLDVSDLDELGEICLVTSSATPPGIPATPVVGCQHVGTSTRKLHATAWRHTFRYEKDTNKQKEEQRRTFTETDPNGLGSKAAAALVDGTPSTPAGLILRETRNEQLTNDHAVNTKTAGVRSTVDDEEMPRTKYETDSAAIDQDTYIAVVFTTGSTPTPPTVSGLVLVGFIDTPLTNAATSNKSVRIFRLAFVNSATRLILARQSITTDPNGLESEQVKADIWDTIGAEPAAPAVPSGLKLNRKLYVAIPSHPTKQVRVFEYAKVDSIDRRVLPHVWTLADPSNVASEGEVAALNSTPTVPGGYKSRGLVGRYQNGTDLLNITKFGLRSEADDITMAGTISRATPEEGRRDTTVSLLSSASSAAAICAAQLAALKSTSSYAGTDVRKIHDNLAEVTTYTRDAKTVIQFRAQMNGRRLVPAYYDGSDVMVYLRRKWERTGGKWLMELVPQYRPGAVMAIRIIRWVTTSGGLPMNWNLGGTSNNGTFLGLPIGTVTYVGAAGTVQWTDLPPAEFGVELEADSMGILDLADFSPGLFETATDLTAVTAQSWVAASDVGLACALATPADYSGLI